ncbi:MAG: ABC transporter ATP-binding protein [Planctomycetota bacterium]|jgi:iron(III) transport system ATP-binding protein
MTSITLQSLAKHFDDTVAVDAVDLEIRSGELFFLLGPSGCGKTTLLRMIAGFIEPTRGSIRFGNNDVTNLPPNKRNTGMVFQSYALWPHMTVADNVAYGLNVRKVPAAEREPRVRKALENVHMEEYASRKPNQLSGGQQQRIALARALVIEPTVLLLDEPLSNLDAKLRMEMRVEIRRLCTATGITTVYVTHDQKEALSMADRVAVLDRGRVMQVGSPRELYDRPATRFVADFLGETNFLAATVESMENGLARLDTPAGHLLSSVLPGPATLEAGENVTCSVRPESLRVVDAPADRNAISGTRRQSIYLGEVAQHVVELAGGTLVRALELNPSHFGEPGDTMHLSIDPDDIVILSERGRTDTSNVPA